MLFTQSFFLQLNAQDLITDRPNITASAVTVPFHFVQIETGYQYNKNGLNSAEHFGTTLLRFGLTPGIELRFAGEYQSLKINPGIVALNTGNNFSNPFQNRIQGLSGTMAGAKFQLIKEKNSEFNFAVLAQFLLPWGKKELVPNNIEPEIIFAFDKDITNGFNVAINAGWHWDSQAKNSILFYSLSSDISLSDLLSIYAEYSGTYQNINSANEFINILDGGFMFLIKANLQLDLYAGTNVITNELNWFWGTGISVRLPH